MEHDEPIKRLVGFRRRALLHPPTDHIAGKAFKPDPDADIVGTPEGSLRRYVPRFNRSPRADYLTPVEYREDLRVTIVSTQRRRGLNGVLVLSLVSALE
jgi:hypothetical protein